MEIHSGQLDRVSDRRIERVVPLIAPRDLLEELPLVGELAEVVVRGRSQVADILAGTDDRLLVVVGPCSVHDTDAARDYAVQLERVRLREREGPVRGHARVLREAAHHDRVEGPDQRPPPRRLRRRERGAAHGARAAAGGARPRIAGGVRISGSDHAAVHLGHRRLGRDRRAHRGKPDPPPAGLGPVDAGGLQEPHRRQRAGGRGRRARGCLHPRVRGRGHRRHAGDPAHDAATPTAT